MGAGPCAYAVLTPLQQYSTIFHTAGSTAPSIMRGQSRLGFFQSLEMRALQRTPMVVRQGRSQGKGMASCFLYRPMTRSIFSTAPKGACLRFAVYPMALIRKEMGRQVRLKPRVVRRCRGQKRQRVSQPQRRCRVSNRRDGQCVLGDASQEEVPVRRRA